MKLKLVECFWLTAFFASCLSSLTDHDTTAIAFSLVLLIAIAIGDSTIDWQRSIKHYAPLIIGPVMGYAMWRLDLVSLVPLIGLIAISYGTYLSIGVWREKRNNEIWAIIAVGWAVIFIDGLPDIYTTKSIVVQTIMSTIGLFSSVAIYRWTNSKLATCIAMFWTIQTCLIFENATSDWYGIGWLYQWRS